MAMKGGGAAWEERNTHSHTFWAIRMQATRTPTMVGAQHCCDRNARATYKIVAFGPSGRGTDNIRSLP